MILDPKNDGVDHINVYSKGATELGRLLTNFSRHTFTVHGESFSSLEAWWYWELLREAGVVLRWRNEELPVDIMALMLELKFAWGVNAKTIGTKLTAMYIPNRGAPSVEFRKRYAEAAAERLQSDLKLIRLLRDSHLPLVHYYWYGRAQKIKVVQDLKHQWVLDVWTDFRKQLQDELNSN